MYAVVEWVDENPRQVSVVPLTWIIEGNGEALCYWPPECIAKKLKRKDFETQRLPAPVEDWSRHRVRCLRIEENYTVALKKCEDATFTSDLSSAESECERKRRRERCRVVLSDHNVMSDENARINKQSNNVGNKVASGSIFAEKPRVPLSLLMRCKDAVRKNAMTSGATIKETEVFMKIWLRNAPDRGGGRMARMKKAAKKAKRGLQQRGHQLERSHECFNSRSSRKTRHDRSTHERPSHQSSEGRSSSNKSRSSRTSRHRDPSSRDRSQSRSSWKGRHRDPSSRDRSQSRSSWKGRHRDPSSRDRSQSRSSRKGRHRDPSSRDRSQSRSSRKGRRRDPSSRDRSQSRSSRKGRRRDPSSRDRSQSRSSWKGRHRDPSSCDRSQSRSSRKGRRRDPSSCDSSDSRSSRKGRHRDPSSRDRSENCGKL